MKTDVLGHIATSLVIDGSISIVKLAETATGLGTAFDLVALIFPTLSLLLWFEFVRGEQMQDAYIGFGHAF